MQIHSRKSEPSKVTLVDTREDSNSVVSLCRVKDYIENKKFCLLMALDYLMLSLKI